MNYDDLINNTIIDYYNGVSIMRFSKIDFEYSIHSHDLGLYCGVAFRKHILGDIMFDPNSSFRTSINFDIKLLTQAESISEIKKYALDYINVLIKYKICHDEYKNNY